MQITVGEASRLLKVPESTLYRWIREGRIPASRVQDDWRFNPVEILDWATRHQVEVAPALFAEAAMGSGSPSLATAIDDGGVHLRVPGTDKAAALRAMVATLHLPVEADRDLILAVLLAREDLGSTGLGDGIAIPHVKSPLVLSIPRPQVAVGYLDHAVDFDAVDGQPVSVLFMMLSPSIRAHLQLLSRLTYFLRAPEFREGVRRRVAAAEIVAIVRALEARLPA